MTELLKYHEYQIIALRLPALTIKERNVKSKHTQVYDTTVYSGVV